MLQRQGQVWQQQKVAAEEEAAPCSHRSSSTRLDQRETGRRWTPREVEAAEAQQPQTIQLQLTSQRTPEEAVAQLIQPASQQRTLVAAAAQQQIQRASQRRTIEAEVAAAAQSQLASRLPEEEEAEARFS